MFLTSQLVLMVFMLGVEKHKSTFMAPVAIGITLMVLHLVGIFYTGASMNPARSFGPDAVTGNFPGYHWIYCKAPKSVRYNNGRVGTQSRWITRLWSLHVLEVLEIRGG